MQQPDVFAGRPLTAWHAEKKRNRRASRVASSRADRYLWSRTLDSLWRDGFLSWWGGHWTASQVEPCRRWCVEGGGWWRAEGSLPCPWAVSVLAWFAASCSVLQRLSRVDRLRRAGKWHKQNNSGLAHCGLALGSHWARPLTGLAVAFALADHSRRGPPRGICARHP